jgi:hypothetical protein
VAVDDSATRDLRRLLRIAWVQIGSNFSGFRIYPRGPYRLSLPFLPLKLNLESSYYYPLSYISLLPFFEFNLTVIFLNGRVELKKREKFGAKMLIKEVWSSVVVNFCKRSCLLIIGCNMKKLDWKWKKMKKKKGWEEDGGWSVNSGNVCVFWSKKWFLLSWEIASIYLCRFVVPFCTVKLSKL